METLVTVCVNKSARDCFLTVTKDLANKWSHEISKITHIQQSNPLVLEITHSSGNTIKCSWSGRSVKDSGEKIFVSNAMLQSLQLEDGSEVIVSILKDSVGVAESVVVCPLQEGDWQLLELNATSIETELLNQIRLVYPGLHFPVYVNGAFVPLDVVSTVPSGAVLLQEMTEVHLMPNQLPSMTDHADSHHIKQHFTTSTNKCINPLKAIVCGPKTKNIPNLESTLFDALEDFMSHYVSKTEIKQSKHSTTQDKKLCSKKIPKKRHLEAILRIQPVMDISAIIDDTIVSSNLEICTCQEQKDYKTVAQQSSYILSPYQAFICEETFRTFNSTCSNGSSHLYIELIRLSNPLLQSSGSDDHGDDAKLGLNVTIIPRSTWSRICGESWQHSIAVNPIVMEQLNILQGERVSITCFHRQLESLQMIVLHTSQTITMSPTIMQSLFENYLKSCLSGVPSFVINQGTLLHFRDKEVRQSAVIELIGIKNTVFAEIDRTNLSQIVSYIDNSEEEEVFQREVYLPFQDFKKDISNLGGLDDLFEKAVSHINRTLFCQNCSNLHEEMAVCCHGALLIHGSNSNNSGCGKTSFALSLCTYFQKQPYFCHIEIIDCISLRGKRVETICEKWFEIYKDCLWKQPTIIVFDDLDQLLLQTDPLQDGGATVVYSIRLVDAFKAFTRMIMFENCKISVVATASCLDKLNINILPESGSNVFAEFLEIAYNSIEQRREILEKMIAGIGITLKQAHDKISDREFSVILSNDDKENIIRTFDNFSPNDILQVTKRASHRAAISLSDTKQVENKNETVKSQIIVNYEHFVTASRDYKAPGISSLNLNKPDAVQWSDVGGLHGVKSILTETLLWPAKYPSLYKSCGIRLRSGLLLYGAPGTAKTLLATAVAHECGLNFIGVKGPELLNKYVGSSEHNVRDLFARAQAAQPCIIFFDEFDSLAPRRGHDNTGVTDRVVNQLLTQLDGVEALEGVFVLAATSRPDLIDPALLRPGRLDKSVFCPMPDAAERLEILTIIARQLNIGNVADLSRVAEETEGFSGADLKALIYNAQVEAVHACIDGFTASAEDHSKVPKVIKISHENITFALKTTHPSVSPSERSRYERIFRSFGEAKSEQKEVLQQKVTFA